MKLQYKIKKVVFITEDDETIEAELKKDAPYFVSINIDCEEKEIIELTPNVQIVKGK